MPTFSTWSSYPRIKTWAQAISPTKYKSHDFLTWVTIVIMTTTANLGKTIRKYVWMKRKTKSRTKTPAGTPVPPAMYHIINDVHVAMKVPA